MISDEYFHKLPAKIIQLSVAQIAAGPNCGEHCEQYALCSDGSLWMRYVSNGYANVPMHGGWYLVHPAQPKLFDRLVDWITGWKED